MFVLSLKASKIKKVVFILLIMAIAAGASVYLLTDCKDYESVVANKTVYQAKTNEQTVSFITSFGWEVKDDPIEIIEVIIPEEFNETYKKYNELQKEQGFDLEKHKGERVKRRTYEITNYPDTTLPEGVVRANVLILDGKVIGADVCNIEMDGKMEKLVQIDN